MQGFAIQMVLPRLSKLVISPFSSLICRPCLLMAVIPSIRHLTVDSVCHALRTPQLTSGVVPVVKENGTNGWSSSRTHQILFAATAGKERFCCKLCCHMFVNTQILDLVTGLLATTFFERKDEYVAHCSSTSLPKKAIMNCSYLLKAKAEKNDSCRNGRKPCKISHDSLRSRQCPHSSSQAG